MIKYIVLLRGINVGGRTIKMDELRACLEAAGFRKVITVLQTGNLILESGEKNIPKLRLKIEDILGRAFQYPAKALVITPAALKEIIGKYPASKEYGEDFHRYVVFTENGFEKELCRLAGEPDKQVETVIPGRDVVYWRVLKGRTLDSDFGKLMAKAAAKQFLTNRNLNTLEKIFSKCG